MVWKAEKFMVAHGDAANLCVVSKFGVFGAFELALLTGAADIMSCPLGWNGYPDLGQFVVTGEPVAVMGGGAQWPLPKRAVQTNPYFTWSSARAGFPSIQARGGPEGQKVRG